MESLSRAILLTGERGVGKTTTCQAVADLARHRGYQPGGVITPAIYDGRGTKLGFEAVDVGNGERWPLARTDPSTTLQRGSGQGSGHRRELGGPRVGSYSFDPDGLARALRVLRSAATAGCDLLMVDEIGPLELEQGQGFAPILDLLPVEGLTHTLIVVRPALLDRLLLNLRGTECTIFCVTEENRDKLPLQIVEELWGDG
jgi:nucleoside-triphosphatase THEP1